MSTAEYIDYYIVLSLYSLKRWEETLAQAESFLKNHPSSAFYGSVKMFLTQALGEVQGRDAKRKRAEKAASELIEQLESSGDQNRDLLLFQISMAFFGEGIYETALAYFRRIDLGNLEQLQIPADNVLYSIFSCYYGLQDKPGAARVLKTLETLHPESSMLQAMRSMMSMFPE